MNDQTKTGLRVAAMHLRTRASDLEDQGLCWTVVHGTHVVNHLAKEAAGYRAAAALIDALLP